MEWITLSILIFMYPFTKSFHSLQFMQLHGIFGVLLTLGIVLFTVWAIKHLSKDKLKKLWVWLIVLGFLGSVLLSGGMMKGKFGKFKSHDKAEKNAVMQEVFKAHGVEIADEEFELIMKEVKEKMGLDKKAKRFKRK